jgi:hypothetical protein
MGAMSVTQGFFFFFNTLQLYGGTCHKVVKKIIHEL